MRVFHFDVIANTVAAWLEHVEIVSETNSVIVNKLICQWIKQIQTERVSPVYQGTEEIILIMWTEISQVLTWVNVFILHLALFSS